MGRCFPCNISTCYYFCNVNMEVSDYIFTNLFINCFCFYILPFTVWCKLRTVAFLRFLNYMVSFQLFFPKASWVEVAYNIFIYSICNFFLLSQWHKTVAPTLMIIRVYNCPFRKQICRVWHRLKWKFQTFSLGIHTIYDWCSIGKYPEQGQIIIPQIL